MSESDYSADGVLAPGGAPRIGARLRLCGLRKTYGHAAAVHHVDLDIRAGEFVTLLGASGSGKTTTLMMIAGFTDPTGGEIFIDDESVTRLPPSRRNLGVVFQNYSLFPHLTVRQNVTFPLQMRGMKKPECDRRAAEILELVHLPDKADSYPRQLSGGQQQRVALARALVFGPRVLLMDEPLGALDKKLRENMQLEIKRIQAELGATVVYVTHDQEEALTMSDRVAVMQNGRIAQIGAPADLYDRPASRWVADFIGQSNFVSGTVRGPGAPGTTIVDFVSGETAAVESAVTRAPGTAVTVVLRPEKLHLSSAASPQAGAANQLLGTVSQVVYLGHAIRRSVRLSDGTVLQVQSANLHGAVPADAGARVAVTWSPSDGWILPEEDAAP
jgi:putative spermidine/putrescine transport system ATP-binding protein